MMQMERMIELSELPELPSLTKWQLLFRNYDKAIWQDNKASFRTTNVVGTTDEDVDVEILKAIAQEITMWREREFRHFNEKRKRMGVNTENTSETGTNLDEMESVIDKQLEELLGGTPETVITTTTQRSTSKQVDASQIELIEINENSRADVSIYPTSFRCPWCGHYELVDPRKRTNLVCPCCTQAWCPGCRSERKFTKDNKCQTCNGPIRRNELYQFSFVFACPRCANIEPLTPAIAKLRNLIGSTIPCQTQSIQCNGHMHFWYKGTFGSASWRCVTCGYRERVNKHCVCHIPKIKESGQEGRPSAMKPTTTSATSIMRPLIRSYLYMGTSSVTLNTLASEHDKSKSLDPLSWSLEDQVSPIDIQVIREQYGITRAFTVPNIITLTIVYGYISGIQTYPNRIEEDERLAQLFKDGHKYRAYAVKTKGRGLVIVLDKEKVLRILRKSGFTEYATYEELVNATRTEMEVGKFQQILEDPNRVALTALLHSVEHALLKNLMEQTGLEDFGSKIMLDDCCIVLYERENLGSGGLAQVTKSTQGLEFKKFLMNSERENLHNCPQLCSEGCPACIYINDYHCQPYIPTEVPRWFPPNSIMNRELAKDFFEAK